jgi:hypothetical protein
MPRILMFNSAANDVRPSLPTKFVGFSTDITDPKYSYGIRLFSGDGEERVLGVEMCLDIDDNVEYTLNFYLMYWNDYAALGYPPPRPDFGTEDGSVRQIPQGRWPAGVKPTNERWMREVIESAAADGTVTHAPVTRTLAFGAADGSENEKRRYYLPLAVHARWAALAMAWDTTAPTDGRFYVFGHVGGHSEVTYVESEEKALASGYPYRYEANIQIDTTELPTEI